MHDRRTELAERMGIKWEKWGGKIMFVCECGREFQTVELVIQHRERHKKNPPDGSSGGLAGRRTP